MAESPLCPSSAPAIEIHPHHPKLKWTWTAAPVRTIAQGCIQTNKQTTP